jgi:hypothetical protein
MHLYGLARLIAPWWFCGPSLLLPLAALVDSGTGSALLLGVCLMAF